MRARAIYETPDAHTMRLCYGAFKKQFEMVRPGEFKSTAGSEITIIE